MKIAGLDIGTTGCKLTVFAEDGRYLDKAYRDYPARRMATAHEIDASAIMAGVYGVMREMAGKYPDIAAIGVTSFGETFVMLDERDDVLNSAMLYTDPRGRTQIEALKAAMDPHDIMRITGLRPHSMYSLSKLMWMKEHHPDMWADTKRILLMEDYVVYRLTGVRQIDYSLATRTMAFDIAKLDWSEAMFDLAGIDPRLMSKPVPTGTPAGTLTRSAAQEVGLPQSVVIVSVSHDQVAAAIGAGAFDGSVAVDGAGTVECLTPIYDGMPDLDVMYEGYYSVVPHAVPGKYVAYAFSYTGGALIDWCIRRFAKEERARFGGDVNRALEQAYIDARGDTPSGLIVLPHLAGAATPYMDNDARGAMLGLGMETDLPDIYRACMEGVAYEMRLNVDALQGSGVRFTKLNATGGGARSIAWMQMKADVLDMPITALETADAGTVGCAMLTGVATGVFRDLDDAAEHMVKEVQTYRPRAEMHEKYMEIYRKYEKAYGLLKELRT